MLNKKVKLTRTEKKLLLRQALDVCHARAAELKKSWKPIDKSWPTKDGAAYIRLSTEDQVLVKNGSLEQQINLAFEEVEKRSKKDKVNYRIIAVYIDAGISGQTDKRPEFLKMQNEVAKGRLAFVIIKDVARIFRQATFFAVFFELCISSGCEVIFKDLPINPNDPNDVLKLRMHAAIAEYEARNNSKRVKENLHSAMINNGKFNATHLILGLDQLVENGHPLVGLYTPNFDELKIVHWIMEYFVRVGSYQVTLQEIYKRGIKNKNGVEFKKNSLYSLLTNMKYIGKWEANKENKNSDNRNLMSYELYVLVDLPHGCVIDLELWHKVQDTVQRLKGSKAKNTCISRVYLLSGLLKLAKDGSNFGGSSANGNTQRTDYYQNTKHRIRLRAEVIEHEAKKVLIDVIKNSPRLQTALIERAKSSESAVVQLKGQVELIENRISQLQVERINLDKRLDFIIAGASEDEAKSFKSEYIQSVNKIKEDIELCKQQIGTIERSRLELQDADLSTTSLVNRAEKILKLIAERDPVALKNAYRTIFKSIEVGDLDSSGKRELRFRISSSESAAPVNRAEDFGIENKMAQMAGLEPATKRLTVACSTN